MSGQVTFRCNLPNRRKRRGEENPPHVLKTKGPDANVNVHLHDIARVLVRDLDGRLADLLEFASCAYAADAAISRTGWSRDGSTERWVRHIRLELGVRDPVFWNGTGIAGAFAKALGILSGDRWELAFEPLAEPLPASPYLDLGADTTADWPFREPERVLMFSGGLDSLAGAVQQAARDKPLLLISHHAAPQIHKRQTDLLAALKAAFPGLPVRRVGVWVNRAGETRGTEYTQRTRSFLFWAIGLAVGVSIKAGGVRFFENGVVSLNLPVEDQVVGSRASRTTNPVALAALERLGALVAGRAFIVDNPFLTMTKGEVVDVIVKHGKADLIRHTCSCTKTIEQRKVAWHCGVCSQCIDRRFGVLAADAAEHDPVQDYRIDPLLGARPKREDQIMAAAYTRHALELAAMTPDDVASKFATEVGRAASGMGDVNRSSRLLCELHVRHGNAVRSVVASLVSDKASDIVDQTLAATSLVGLCIKGEHARPSWQMLAARIRETLARGLPAACQTAKPLTEPHLQEICDGLLKAASVELEREYPTMRWATRGTKPDWSDEGTLLWVELKYVRKKADVGPIEGAIAQDLTKYGDIGRHCMFITYDPLHHVVDEEKFSAPVNRRLTMMACVIR